MGYQNRFATKLDGAIGASDTTITLKTVPTVTSGRLVIEPTNSTKFEIVKYTGIVGNTITGVTRGDGGTTAQTHAADSNVQMNITAQDIQDIYDAFASFSATNNDWRSLVGAATVVQNNGNRSVDMQIAGNHTSYLSKGMRLNLPRTGTAVQTQVTSLNGTNQYWNKTAPAGMTFTDDFTVGAWVKLSSYQVNSVIMSRYNGTSGWRIKVESDGTVGLLIYNGSSANFRRVKTYQSIPLNKWVHIAAQMDASAYPTTSATQSYFMIDGVDVPCVMDQGGTNPTALVQAGNLEVGSSNASDFFPGEIAQAFVSSAKITQANVRTFMNASLTPALCTTHNIISAYAFGGNGTDINTTNANNLTGQNGAVATNADSPFNANAYAIIMSDPVYGGANTTFNVQTPEGYSIPNATLGTASYSSVKVPYGFPANADKWSIGTYLIALSSRSGTSTGTTYSFNGFVMNVPTGAWKLSYSGILIAEGSSGTLSALSGLSTTTNSFSEPFSVGATPYMSVASTFTEGQVSGSATVNPSTATPYYLNAKAATGTVTSMTFNHGNRSGNSSIVAENAYL